MRLTFAELNSSTIRQIVRLQEQGVVPAHWDGMQVTLEAHEQQQLQTITAYLRNYQLSLMNEATIWSRAIYPLLLLAETAPIQAWAQVPLRAGYPQFELEGLADGVLGYALSGQIDSPYLVVVEAKRGLEAQNPQFQLYGSLLAAAWLNQQKMPADQQEMYGCYTIADSWTFVQAIVSGFAAEKPVLTVRFSREYAERLEAEAILRILKYIVQQALAPSLRS
jgi:hypothetical protein